MKKAKKLPVIVLLVLITLLLFASCGKPEESVTTPGSTEAQITTEPEKSYAFLESPLCQEVDRGLTHNPYLYFRHAPNCVKADPLVPVQIEKPKTVMINGRECAVGKLNYHQGRTVSFEIETVGAYTEYSNRPAVNLDVITGQIVGIVNVYLDTPDMGDPSNLEEAYLVRARSAVAHHFPNAGIEGYVVDTNNMTANDVGFGSIIFNRKIDGQRTSSEIVVRFEKRRVVSIYIPNVDDFNDFDTALLDYDKEEHARLIESFAEYVCNGHEMQSVEINRTTLVKTADGDYAMEYQLDIEIVTAEGHFVYDHFSFRITLQ